MPRTCVVVGLCLVLLVTGCAAKKKDQQQQRGPKFDFKDCGGAKACLGEERLGRLLGKTGMAAHKSVDDLANLLDQDPDLGFDQTNDMLQYACSHGVAPPAAAATTAAATAAAQGVASLPEQAQANPVPAAGEVQEATGNRKLLASSSSSSKHTDCGHHHHHVTRKLQQRVKASPSPAPVPSPSPAPAPVTVTPEVASGWMPSVADTAGPVPITQASAFKLHSRPGAPHRVLLDFDGVTTINTAWNAQYQVPVITTPPFDKDGSPSTWSAAELADIVAIWRSVAEDFAPFDVDITTEDPGDVVMAANSTRVAIGGSYNDWAKIPMAGTAYIPAHNIPDASGSLTYYQPAFVFAVDLSNYAKYMQESIAHEIGHALGLHHDLDTQPDGSAGDYSQGLGNWAPIMGASYYREVTQFSDGSYPGGYEKEDDFAIMSGFIPYIPQEQGTSMVSATPLAMQRVTTTRFTQSVAGIVRGPLEADMWRFTVPSTNTFKNGVFVTAQLQTLSPNAAGFGRTNLWATLEVRRASSATATTSSQVLLQTGSTIAPTTTLKQTAGVFYVSVWGAGDASYSAYGSRGQYQLTVTYMAA